MGTALQFLGSEAFANILGGAASAYSAYGSNKLMKKQMEALTQNMSQSKESFENEEEKRKRLQLLNF